MNDEVVIAVAGEVFDELPIDFDGVGRDIFEVAEGAKAGTEVVKTEDGAEAVYKVSKPQRFLKVADRCGFGDFKDQATCGRGGRGPGLFKPKGKIGVAEGLSGDIDSNRRCEGVLLEFSKGRLDDPAVEDSDLAALFSDGDEAARSYETTGIFGIAHADEGFDMLEGAIKAIDPLVVEFEKVFR
ncbi:MAG: hypothetical protein N2557_04780 [Hydrogenophilus sp.]|nr:hypothetical protein [Hydrogenophilus sp.]